MSRGDAGHAEGVSAATAQRARECLQAEGAAAFPRLLAFVYLANDVLCACHRRRAEGADWWTDATCVALRRHLVGWVTGGSIELLAAAARTRLDFHFLFYFFPSASTYLFAFMPPPPPLHTGVHRVLRASGERGAGGAGAHRWGCTS
jgi:hypothetical protein